MSAKPKPHKQATFNKAVQAAKAAIVVEDPDSFLSLSPTWRLLQLEMVDPYGFHAVTIKDATDIKERLGSFERMTWREILYGGKRNHHLMPVDALKCPKALQRLEDIAPDVDTLMSLRITQKGRVWGIMFGAVCSLVFWDPDHQIYEMNIADN